MIDMIVHIIYFNVCESGKFLLKYIADMIIKKKKKQNKNPKQKQKKKKNSIIE